MDIVQNIYNDEELLDFDKHILIPLPNSSMAVRYEDHGTNSLINRTATIVLNLIKNRIAPMVERQLSDSMERHNGCNMSVANNCGKIYGNAKNTVHLFHAYPKVFDRVKAWHYFRNQSC